MGTEFKDWPDHYSFPPFFTVQPNKATQDKQLSIWIDLIKAYCSATRKFSLDKGNSIFTNASISRSLSQEGVALVFAEMVRTGQAEYIDATKKDRIFVWWFSKDDWARKLTDFASKNGLLNSVATVYELINDNPEFKGMDEPALIRILQVLEGKGKCELMKGNGGVVDGVKFFM